MQNLFLNLLAMSTKVEGVVERIARKEQHIYKADYTSQNDCKEKFAKILQDEGMNSPREIKQAISRGEQTSESNALIDLEFISKRGSENTDARSGLSATALFTIPSEEPTILGDSKACDACETPSIIDSPNQFYHSEFVKQTTDPEGLPSNEVKRNASKVKGKLREQNMTTKQSKMQSAAFLSEPQLQPQAIVATSNQQPPYPPFPLNKGGQGVVLRGTKSLVNEVNIHQPLTKNEEVSPAFAGRARSQRFAFEQSEGPVLERIEPKAEGPDSRDSAQFIPLAGRNVGEPFASLEGLRPVDLEGKLREQLWQAPRGEYRVAILTEPTPRETGDMQASSLLPAGRRDLSETGIEAQTSPRLPLLHTSPQSVPLHPDEVGRSPRLRLMYPPLGGLGGVMGGMGSPREISNKLCVYLQTPYPISRGEEHGIDTELSSNLSAQEGDVDGDRAHRPYTVVTSGLRELIQLTRNHEQTNLSDVLPTDVITQIGDEIQVNLKMGRQELRVQLKPEHLGSITLKVSMVEGVLSVDISTENTAVKSIIESHLHDLRQNLLQRGIEVGRFNISAEGHRPSVVDQEGDNMSQFGSQGGMFSSYSGDSRRNARQSPSWEELRVGSQQSLLLYPAADKDLEDETLEQKNWFLKQTMVDIWI